MPNRNEHPIIGFCIMPSKLNRPHVQKLIRRISRSFHTITFTKHQILETEIDKWPKVDILITFYHSDLPFEKVVEYADLNNCFCINDLRMVYALMDRRLVYKILACLGIPVPEYIVINRPFGEPCNRNVKFRDDFSLNSALKHLDLKECTASEISNIENTCIKCRSVSCSTDENKEVIDEALNSSDESLKDQKESEKIVLGSLTNFKEENVSSNEKIFEKKHVKTDYINDISTDMSNKEKTIEDNTKLEYKKNQEVTHNLHTNNNFDNNLSDTKNDIEKYKKIDYENKISSFNQLNKAEKFENESKNRDLYINTSLKNETNSESTKEMKKSKKCINKYSHHEICPYLKRYLSIRFNSFFDDIDKPDNDLKIEETPDYISINGYILKKPFVEKPVCSEDHNVYIYYPGNITKKLFRKKNNKSSEIVYDHPNIRKDSSYIYEKFYESSEGKDIKVYALGKETSYAESRKSPVVDGIVERDLRGKEIRGLVKLGEKELEYGRRICDGFKQFVCGFDILRSDGRSFVIDVNGWSFVKTGNSYYDMCASALKNEFERIKLKSECKYKEFKLKKVVRIYRHGDRTPKQKIKIKMKGDFENDESEIVIKNDFSVFVNVLKVAYQYINSIDVSKLKEPEKKAKESEFLHKNIRTEKNNSEHFEKIQINYLQPNQDHKEKHGESPSKNKSSTQILETEKIQKKYDSLEKSSDCSVNINTPLTKSDFSCNKDCNSLNAFDNGLNKIADINGDKNLEKNETENSGTIDEYKEYQKNKQENNMYKKTLLTCKIKEVKSKIEISNAEDIKTLEKLIDILEIENLNIKDRDSLINSILEMIHVIESVMDKKGMKVQIKCIKGLKEIILKWGGVLTHTGKHQARELGEDLRYVLTENNKEILENVKIYSSSESRVFESADFFIKALNLEDEQDKDIKSRVEINKMLLDDTFHANIYIEEGRKHLSDSFNKRKTEKEEKRFLEMIHEIKIDSDKEEICKPGPINEENANTNEPQQNNGMFNRYISKIRGLFKFKFKEKQNDTKEINKMKELQGIKYRWWKLKNKALKDNTMTYSMISEIYDNLKYDMAHNNDTIRDMIGEENIIEFYLLIKRLYMFIVRNEYGDTKKEKYRISKAISKHLLAKIFEDFGFIKNSSGDSKNENIEQSNENIARIYFTKESRIYTLFNMLNYFSCENKELKEFGYGSMIGIDLYESNGHEMIKVFYNRGANYEDVVDGTLDSRHRPPFKENETLLELSKSEFLSIMDSTD